MELKYSTYDLEAGTDEAGRGCLAGPVVAAAVILPDDFEHEWLDDSKKLSLKKRTRLRPIIEREAIAYGLAFVDREEIDRLNVLWASIEAMHRSLDQLKIRPEFVAVDGNKFKDYRSLPHRCLVKGDSRYMNIAAASVLAKTYRDDYMEKIHKDFPMYAWDKNKGYPTKAHRQAIRTFGSCTHHRTTFKLLPEQMRLDL